MKDLEIGRLSMWAKGNHKTPYERKVRRAESEKKNGQIRVIKEGVMSKESGRPLEAGKGKEMILS